MERYTIYCRTEAGEAAFEAKQISDRSERAILTSINGRATLDEIIRQHGDEAVVRAAILSLEHKGLVETIDARIQRAVEEQPTIFLQRQKSAGLSSAPSARVEAPAPSMSGLGSSATLSHSSGMPSGFSEALTTLSVRLRLSLRWIFLAALILVLVGIVWSVGSQLMSTFDRSKPQFWLGQQVHYTDRGIAFRPLPVIELSNVTVGESKDFVIDKLWIVPDIWNLLTGRSKRLRLQAGVVSTTPAALARLGKTTGESTWKVSSLDFQTLTVRTGASSINAQNGELQFAETGILERARAIFDEGALIAEAMPAETGELQVLLRADHWAWKALPSLKMERLVAEGRLNEYGMILNQVTGNLAGGAISGAMQIDYAQPLSMVGNLKINHARAQDLLGRFYPKHTVTSGGVDVEVKWRGNGPEFGKMNISAEGSYAIVQGVIERFGLLEGVRRNGGGLAGGGLIRFERLDGTFNGQTEAATNVSIKHIDSGALQGSGQLKIESAGEMSGKMSASVKMPGGERRSRSFKVGGMVDSPRLEIIE